MRVHFINGGYGEAVVIDKDEYKLLVDAGTNRGDEYKVLGSIRVVEYLKKIGVSKLDMIIATHIHDDHIGGLPEVIKNISASELVINIMPPALHLEMINRLESISSGNLSGNLFLSALRSYAEVSELCAEQGIFMRQSDCDVGPVSPMGGLTLEFLTPDRELQAEMQKMYRCLSQEKTIEKAEELFYKIDKLGNSASIALRVKAGSVAVLLSGDKVDGWDKILEINGDRLGAGILKVAHHGQLDGLPDAILKIARPEHFVICSSADRRFNSAHPKIIEKIRTYFKEHGKQGRVYITGSHENGKWNSLSADLIEGYGGGEGKMRNRPCSVIFDCNEDTGEITVEYIKS